MHTAKHYIEKLNLLPHPEGGYYKETYRAALTVDAFGGKRNASTAIFFLLEANNFSAFHRIKSDEVWHFYAGDELEILEIDESGRLINIILGKNNFQYVVKAGCWFGSRVKAGGQFSLVGCTVAPGFDFADFEMADREKLVDEFPQHVATIKQLTRE